MFTTPARVCRARSIQVVGGKARHGERGRKLLHPVLDLCNPGVPLQCRCKLLDELGAGLGLHVSAHQHDLVEEVGHLGRGGGEQDGGGVEGGVRRGEVVGASGGGGKTCTTS